MVKKEMLPILERLVTCCVPEKNRKAVEELIGNEKVHYIEPHHKKLLLPGPPQSALHKEPQIFYLIREKIESGQYDKLSEIIEKL